MICRNVMYCSSKLTQCWSDLFCHFFQQIMQLIVYAEHRRQLPLSVPNVTIIWAGCGPINNAVAQMSLFPSFD